MVKYVNSLDEFLSILKENKDKLVVVDFTASWCGPCQRIGPEFERLSKLPEYANIVFLKVDVDDSQDVSEHCNIRAMPTFQFYKNEAMVYEFSGADGDKLVEKINALRS